MTLLVVDIQPYFGSHRKCLPGVLREAQEAKLRNEPVVVLEYYNCGPTTAALKRALRGHQRVLFIEKRADDGSCEFIQAAHQLRATFRQINICGVNTCACVGTTVSGIRDRVPEVAMTFKNDAVACSCVGVGNSCKRGLTQRIKWRK